MNTVTETQALPITITPIVMVQTTTTTLTLVVTIAIHKVILPITITLIVMVQTTTTGVVTQAHTELVETTTILMTDKPTITPMMDMITFSMVVVILHTLMATVVPVVELVEDLVGLVMRDAKTTTQSATLMKIPVLITMMPIHQNAEITIPILSLPLTFAVLAMEVAPEAILEATAMEMARVTELAMGQELDTDMVQEPVVELVEDLKQSYMMVAPMTIH